jgi:hypothetical protein
MRKHDIIPTLIDISKTAIKEKINRLVIGIFRVTTVLGLLLTIESR